MTDGELKEALIFHSVVWKESFLLTIVKINMITLNVSMLILGDTTILVRDNSSMNSSFVFALRLFISKSDVTNIK